MSKFFNLRALMSAITGILIAPMATFGLLAESHIVVSKVSMEIAVVENSETVFRSRCAVGRNFGDKQADGDCKTPEGTFPVISIEDSSRWKHDFNDGFGARIGAYGPFFFRLIAPGFRGIGIHGTCFPETIGTRSSEGCIRLRNADLLELKKHIRKGMKCVILNDSI